MKKFIILLVIALNVINAYTQVNMPVDKSGRITYKEILDLNITGSEISQLLDNYISQSEYIENIKNDVETEMQNSEKTEGNDREIIYYKVKIPVYYNEKKEWLNNNPSSTIGTWMKDKDVQYGYVECELSFMIENEKLGYKFTNFIHKHDKEPACGELEQRVGKNTKEFYWNGYKSQVNQVVNDIILEIKALFRDKGLVEEW